ncbi:MAG: hypothetical protein R2848_12255 [Thermomicrobiales bacterium]
MIRLRNPFKESVYLLIAASALFAVVAIAALPAAENEVPFVSSACVDGLVWDGYACAPQTVGSISDLIQPTPGNVSSAQLFSGQSMPVESAEIGSTPILFGIDPATDVSAGRK